MWASALLLVPLLDLLVLAGADSGPSPASTFRREVAPQTSIASVALSTSTQEPTHLPAPGRLELRAIVEDPAAALPPVPAQFPTVTAYWVETTLPNGVKTWIEVVFTQTFDSMINQGPTPVAGEVGMGTLTGAVGVVKTNAAADYPQPNAQYGLGAAFGVVVIGIAELMR